MELLKEISRIKRLIFEFDYQSNPNNFEKNDFYYKLLDQLSELYPETPELVLQEFLENRILNNIDVIKRIEGTYYGDIRPELRGHIDRYLSGPWTLETLKLGFDDFTETTQQGFIDRDFGEENTYLVPDDEERMEYQRKTQKGDGNNIPVVLELRGDKYELIEGWHRVMSILKLGDNGNEPFDWTPQLIRAYVRIV